MAEHIPYKNQKNRLELAANTASDPCTNGQQTAEENRLSQSSPQANAISWPSTFIKNSQEKKAGEKVFWGKKYVDIGGGGSWHAEHHPFTQSVKKCVFDYFWTLFNPWTDRQAALRHKGGP